MITKRDLGILARGIAPVLREFMAHIADRCAALELKERGLEGPVGPKGEPGRDGRDGLPGWIGEKGPPGDPGTNGTNGRDGTLENLKVQFDGERTVTLCFKNGDPIDGGVIRFDIPLDRGVYQDGRRYEKADAVTYAGSFWIAQAETSARPGQGATAWRLAVKRGADGKPGSDGKKGDPGPQGTPGRGYFE